jgi:membrane associated rhomboid family serine protease
MAAAPVWIEEEPMLPIRDHTPSQRMPIVTVTLIAVNVAVFLYEVFVAQGSETFFYQYGLVPCVVTMQCSPIPGALPGWLTFLSAMFMHGGWLHIGGNMLYLWIFGNNVEDILGPIGFTAFYLLCGVLASFAQIATNTASTVVNIGASGAIAGVLGAYLLCFPNARIDTLIFFGYFTRMTTLPAVIVLGGWFVLQLFSGVASLGGPDAGGVAFFAHAGGFIAGMALILPFRGRA